MPFCHLAAVVAGGKAFNVFDPRSCHCHVIAYNKYCANVLRLPVTECSIEDEVAQVLTDLVAQLILHIN